MQNHLRRSPPMALVGGSRTVAGGTGLPRGAHKLDRATVEATQRAQIIHALVSCVAEQGYVATSVAAICARAQVSKSTFYACHRDKEDAFLAAYDAAHGALVSAVIGGQRRDAEWGERMRDSFAAYLRFNHEQPAIARCFLVELHAAGARAWARRDAGHEEFARMQRALYELRRRQQPSLPELPEEVVLAVVAALEEMVATCVRRGRHDAIPALLPQGMYLIEAVYGGAPAAVAALRKA